MTGEWQIDTAYRSGSASGPNRDELIVRGAASQKQLLRAEQLRGLGLSANGIQHRVAAHRLFRVHLGVYALHPPPYSTHQRWLAAVLACGTGSLLSDWCAAGLLGCVDDPPLVAHVSNESGNGRSHPGIVVHRRVVDPRDRASRRGIPCTSAARTLIDVAADCPLPRLEELLMAADSLRVLNRRRLDELIAERPGCPGTGKLRSLLADDPAETRSKSERRMRAICREYGVAGPEVNYRIDVAGRTFYADFCWPDRRLIVEADGWRWHGGRLAGESDADRDQLLSLAGWRVVHFTRDQIVRRRSQTGRRLRALAPQRTAA